MVIFILQETKVEQIKILTFEYCIQAFILIITGNKGFAR